MAADRSDFGCLAGRNSGFLPARGYDRNGRSHEGRNARERQRDGITRAMAERPTSYDYEELLACGRGELFGPGNAQLPLPPMLMFDRISTIQDTGGAHG